MPETCPIPLDPPAALRRRWRNAEPNERHGLIVDAAIRLLHDEGLDAVTIRRLAGCLGVGAMTLYTYIGGQEALRRAMTARGFDLLNSTCRDHTTLDTPDGWRGGAEAYLAFARQFPNLYQLMFATPLPPGEASERVLTEGFEHLLVKVRDRLRARGMPATRIEREARREAARFWIALHGLATLTIADRLAFLHTDPRQLLDDLLERVAPPA